MIILNVIRIPTGVANSGNIMLNNRNMIIGIKIGAIIINIINSNIIILTFIVILTCC